MLHRLQKAGHAPFFAEKSLYDLGMDVQRIAAYAEKLKVDAWIISSGSREILTWFSTRAVPAFAQFGRPTALPIAGMGVRKSPAMILAVRKMIQLGHKRIVMMVREERRKPKPAIYEQAFLDELEKHGIATGPYHLPEWEHTIGDFIAVWIRFSSIHHRPHFSFQSLRCLLPHGIISPRMELYRHAMSRWFAMIRISPFLGVIRRSHTSAGMPSQSSGA